MSLPDKSLRWYLAGPMSNRPKFNFPMFDRVAQQLREEGYTIVTPSELDTPRTRELSLASPDGDVTAWSKACGETWGDVLSRDVKLVADGVDGIILLPGWVNSRGARTEAWIGLMTKKQFATWSDGSGYATTCGTSYVQQTLRESLR